MDDVTGTTAKMFANLPSELGLKRKEVGKREERTAFASRGKRKHENGNQLHPACMEGWQSNYRAIKMYTALSIVSLTYTAVT